MTIISNNQSKAKRIEILLKKKERFIKDYLELAQFKEPIVMLARRSQKVEFYEDATQGIFEFTHSDGTKRKIRLIPKAILTFSYGKYEFKGYWLHEDVGIPLPEEPTITAEQYEMGIDKALNDMKKWKKEEAEGQAVLWGTILKWLAIIMGGYVLVRWLFPNINLFPFGSKTAETAVTVINETARNLTRTIIP